MKPNAPPVNPDGVSLADTPSGSLPKPAAPASVAIQMEDLAVWLVERVAKFPRAHKFTVGEPIVTHSIEVQSLLCETPC